MYFILRVFHFLELSWKYLHSDFSIFFISVEYQCFFGSCVFIGTFLRPNVSLVASVLFFPFSQPFPILSSSLLWGVYSSNMTYISCRKHVSIGLRLFTVLEILRWILLCIIFSVYLCRVCKRGWSESILTDVNPSVSDFYVGCTALFVMI